MARNLVVGEEIFVPISKLTANLQRPSTMLRAEVLSINGRSVEVDVGGGQTELVASSFCHRNVGILLVGIGDFASEATLIDPLCKSVLQYLRMLVPDDQLRFLKVRALNELGEFWDNNHATFSHVVFVGHGNGEEQSFAVDGWVDADTIAERLDLHGGSPKIFINLSCQLGKAAFGQSFSRYNVCDAFIGPFHSVHGSVASHFLQAFFIFHFLNGETRKVSFKHARTWNAGPASFRMWRHGNLFTDD